MAKYGYCSDCGEHARIYNKKKSWCRRCYMKHYQRKYRPKRWSWV